MEEGEPIENALITRAIENAQSKVEGHNFEIRKQLLEYDDVMNQQREVIYQQRREMLTGEDLKATIDAVIGELSANMAAQYADERLHAEEWDWQSLGEQVLKQFNFKLDSPDADTLDGLTADGLAQYLEEAAMAVYQTREAAIGIENMRSLERHIMLMTVDNLWKDHLLSMDHLKEGIGLRGYAQQNPLIVYKKEGFEMFQEMIERIKEETVGILYRVQLAESEPVEKLGQRSEQPMVYSGGGSPPPKKQPVRKAQKKVGRNAPCPCGSGKKFKQCCGR
jgi:preprotein translocase subunit SecA